MQILNEILILQRNSVHGIWTCDSGFPRGMFLLSSPIIVTLKGKEEASHWNTDSGDTGE